MTLIRGVASTVGVILMTLAALVFAIGETTDLFNASSRAAHRSQDSAP